MLPLRISKYFLTAVVTGIFLTGCLFDHEEGHDHDDHDHFTPVGTKVKSDNGHFHGGFTPTMPSEPSVGANQLMMSLTGHDTTVALTGAVITIEPFMVEHNHGTDSIPTVMEMSNHYHASNIYYTMPGTWELRVDVSHNGMSDRFTLTYSVK